MLVGFMI